MLKDKLSTIDPSVSNEYADMVMLHLHYRGYSNHEIASMFGMRGYSNREIASMFGMTASATVGERINVAATTCQMDALAISKGESSDTPIITAEDLERDPRRCMQIMLEVRLLALERRDKKK